MVQIIRNDEISISESQLPQIYLQEVEYELDSLIYYYWSMANYDLRIFQFSDNNFPEQN